MHSAQAAKWLNKISSQLAARRGLGITETINLAVRNELAKDGPAEALPIVPRGEADLLAELDKRLRAVTLDYARLWAKARGTRGVGSRVYQMLAKHGPVETLRLLIAKPTEGLRFLSAQGRMDLSAECVALEPQFASVIPPEIRAQAQAKLKLM